MHDRYGQRSLAFLLSLGLRREDAEDVHQQAWIKILKSLQSKPLEGSFRAWMFQVMRNAAVDSMRKKRPDSIDAAALESTEDDSAESSVEANIIRREYHDALSACLAQLDETTRRLVRGRLAGEDYTGLANQLNLEIARAHRLFFSAKEALGRCVKSRMGDET